MSGKLKMSGMGGANGNYRKVAHAYSCISSMCLTAITYGSRLHKKDSLCASHAVGVGNSVKAVTTVTPTEISKNKDRFVHNIYIYQINKSYIYIFDIYIYHLPIYLVYIYICIIYLFI